MECLINKINYLKKILGNSQNLQQALNKYIQSIPNDNDEDMFKKITFILMKLSETTEKKIKKNQTNLMKKINQ